MLNLTLGSLQKLDGRSCIITRKGRRGYAVYGPYETLGPGKYVVEFRLSLTDEFPTGTDFSYAEIDVATDIGRTVLAKRKVYVSQMRDGRQSFTLRFELGSEKRVEYRVKTTGRLAFAVEEHRLVTKLLDDGTDPEIQLAARRFPDLEPGRIPFFDENRDELRALYERHNLGVRVVDDSIILDTGAISFHAKSYDDLHLVGEVLIDNVYSFDISSKVCVIDIGMNIGLSSLQFASKRQVVEVHSFEPFTNTYDRALDNIDLNRSISGKIHPYNVGLSDNDSDGSIIVPQTAVSGAMSTVGAASGVAISVTLREAAAFLRPIFTSARSRGLAIIVKMDCEGSEFAIMKTLSAAGLLSEISAMMVEWHAMFADRGIGDLIEPLKKAGFLIFDRSPPTGNGFFYAARLS